MGYSPWVCKELDTAEPLHLPFLCLLSWARHWALCPLPLKEVGRQHQG